jgi:hypothetical protein
MTTPEPETNSEEVLQREAEAARARLFQTIDRIEGKAKTFARAAVDTTRVSSWGLAGALALWAGVVLVTRRRERRASTALVLRAPPKRSLPLRIAIMVTRGSAAVLGFLVTRQWAIRFLNQHRLGLTFRAPATPHMRQLGGTTLPALPTEGASVWQPRGTPNA